MSFDRRLTDLESRVGPAQPICIIVVRTPPDVPEDEVDAYVRSHPQSIDRVLEINSGPPPAHQMYGLPRKA